MRQERPKNSKELTAIAIKFFGIYLVVNIVIYAPSVIATWIRLSQITGEDHSLISAILVSGSFILLGLVITYVLFKLANSILVTLACIGARKRKYHQ